jgi:hypothetical protein
MPVRQLPSAPSLDHLKHQAKDLLKSHAARDLGIAQKIREFHPRFSGATDAAIFAAVLKLSDAQLTIAREHGFASWVRMKARIERPTRATRLDLPHHERIEDPVFRHAVDLIDSGDAAGLRLYLKQHPKLVRQRVVFEGMNYFHNPSLLEFIAENPIRWGRMSPHIVDVAEVILDAGTELTAMNDTLGLVCTGYVGKESGMMIPLIDLLCDRGADAEATLHGAALHGYPAAVEALIRRGAHVDPPVAAMLNRVEEFKRLLPGSTAAERHLSLAIAAHDGRLEIARLLLDAGEDPSRYNPVGGHSHGTPLHHAAGFGHLELVKLLVARGARTDLKDVLWHGTPLEWAQHEGRTEVEAYLREVEGRKQ